MPVVRTAPPMPSYLGRSVGYRRSTSGTVPAHHVRKSPNFRAATRNRLWFSGKGLSGFTCGLSITSIYGVNQCLVHIAEKINATAEAERRLWATVSGEAGIQ